MKVFYSILYVSIKPIVKEQLSVGLLLSNGTECMFHYSNDKLNFTKKLMFDDSFNMIKNYIEGFSEDINGIQNSFRINGIDYLNYLSNYNNNLISFSKPTPINVEFSKLNFKSLFEKFVFSYKEEVTNYLIKETPLTVVKEELHPLIKDKVNINKTLTPKEIPGLLIPRVRVNFIGRNNTPVAGDVIDFNSGIGAISNHIGHFMTLIDALNSEKGKYFVIGEEPNKKQSPEQHYTWNQLHNSNTIEFVPLDEIETVSNYMAEHNVKPYVNETK